MHRMDLRGDESVLELGCGPGWFSPTIAARLTSGTLTLCDVQPEMLRLAAERLSAHGNVRQLVTDGTSIPVADGTFDAVLLSAVLGEVPDRKACLREVRRVLRDHGTLTVVETRRDSDFIRRNDLMKLAEDSGFSCVASWGPRWEYTVRFRSSRTAS